MPRHLSGTRGTRSTSATPSGTSHLASCKDDVRRDWVKIYRVKAGKKDPRVYYTKSDRYTKNFKDGKYRGTAQYSYRYYKGHGKHGPWHTFTVRTARNIRLS